MACKAANCCTRRYGRICLGPIYHPSFSMCEATIKHLGVISMKTESIHKECLGLQPDTSPLRSPNHKSVANNSNWTHELLTQSCGRQGSRRWSSTPRSSIPSATRSSRTTSLPWRPCPMHVCRMRVWLDVPWQAYVQEVLDAENTLNSHLRRVLSALRQLYLHLFC